MVFAAVCVIQTPELTITPLCLSGLNEQFACQLSRLPFIYGEIAPRGNVYPLINCEFRVFN